MRAEKDVTRFKVTVENTLAVSVLVLVPNTKAQDSYATMQIFENFASEIPKKTDEGKAIFAKRTNSPLR